MNHRSPWQFFLAQGKLQLTEIEDKNRYSDRN